MERYLEGGVVVAADDALGRRSVDRHHGRDSPCLKTSPPIFQIEESTPGVACCGVAAEDAVGDFSDERERLLGAPSLSQTVKKHTRSMGQMAGPT